MTCPRSQQGLEPGPPDSRSPLLTPASRRALPTSPASSQKSSESPWTQVPHSGTHCLRGQSCWVDKGLRGQGPRVRVAESPKPLPHPLGQKSGSGHLGVGLREGFLFPETPPQSGSGKGASPPGSPLVAQHQKGQSLAGGFPIPIPRLPGPSCSPSGSGILKNTFSQGCSLRENTCGCESRGPGEGAQCREQWVLERLLKGNADS